MITPEYEKLEHFSYDVRFDYYHKRIYNDKGEWVSCIYTYKDHEIGWWLPEEPYPHSYLCY